MASDLERKLEIAKEKYSSEPTLENLIWLGRRMAYTGDFQGAIELYTEALERNPNTPELLRHRGHRYISIGEFDNAVKDLTKAAALIQDKKDIIEEDGIPNKDNIPISTLHFNIYYHLGLAQYLQSNFVRAKEAFTSCYDVSRNDDSRVACLYWLSLIGFHLTGSKNVDFPNSLKDMEIIENHTYHLLLQLFEGILSPEDLEDQMETILDRSTLQYGLAMFYLCQGNNNKATELLVDLVETGHPAAFGTIAGRVELHRMKSSASSSKIV